MYPRGVYGGSGIISGVNPLQIGECWVCGCLCFSSQVCLNTYGFNQLKSVQICKHCAKEAAPGEILFAIAMNGGFRLACSAWNCYERFRMGATSTIKNLFEFRQAKERSYDFPAPSS